LLLVYVFLMRDVREERSVSMVLARMIVLFVRVAICMYALRKAGDKEGDAELLGC